MQTLSISIPLIEVEFCIFYNATLKRLGHRLRKKQDLEVKKPKSCESMSAFANGIGGKLVWGIADDDTLVGLADAKGDSEKISEAIKSHIDPIPDFKLSFAKCEDKEFVVLDVMPGAQTPYYYIGDGQMQAFVRVGSESVVASVAKHKELVLKGSNVSYDSQVSRWRFEDMAFTVLRATYFKRTNRSFEDSDYESFGIVNEKGELTNAGALLADYSPVRHSRLFCTRWNGVDKANGVMDALDDEEYSGSLVTLLPSVEGSWCHSLKSHGRSCIPSLFRSRCDLLHLPLLQLAQLLLIQQLPGPRFSQECSQSQNLRRLFSLSIQVVKPSKSRFLTRSRTSSSMKPRFLKAITWR